jgi:glycosyltransferase involved in cell wall biosynthesis
VARLSPEKGLDTLLAAAALAARKSPDVRFEVAGDGPLFATLQQTAADLNLQQHVHFLGEVRDIPGLLARARAFVLPSRAEGISLTLLEAMASGLPVIATRVGGNPEVVADNETGLLIQADNPPALAEAILTMHGADGRRRLMGTAGRRRAVEYFDVRRMVSNYEQLYINRLGRRIASNGQQCNLSSALH